MSDQTLETLEKKCPRCGAASADSSNPSGRCSACLKKLAANKKKPGHWQRAQTKADDALRRQKGKNGTAHKKSSGLGNRASIVKQTQSAEKKTGEKLSPDRKNNGKGYAASNTRMVPEKLNRGRHHVDEKKLRNWKKKLKKSEIDTASLYTLMKAKYADNDEIQELLKAIGPDGLEQYIELFGMQETQKKSEEFLTKEEAVKLPELPTPTPTGLAAEVGKTHTVEIHPDLDHLYRAKGLIKENNRPHLSIQHFKKAGFPEDIIKKLPRDAHGKVTPEMIDEHIAKLPKKKVNIQVKPYTWGSQQHRPGEQYALSVQMHPEEQMKMQPDQKKTWDDIRTNQHQFSDISNDREKQKEDHSPHQIGWSRIDPHSKDDHWHVDEIQSDFQNKDKIDNKSEGDGQQDYIKMKAWSEKEENKDHPAYNKIKKYVDLSTDQYGSKESEDIYRDAQDAVREHNIIPRGDSEGLLSHLSHGHDDPQHMIHSATNALARKLGVKSMSMDTPQDQADQSGLNTNESADDDLEDDHHQEWVDDHIGEIESDVHSDLWGHENNNKLISEHSKNPNFKSAIEKLGGEDELSELAGSMSDPKEYSENVIDDKPEFTNAYNKLSQPEKDAIHDYTRRYQDWVHDIAYDKASDRYPGAPPRQKSKEEKDSFDISKLPVHQLNTYHKRPRKLGMKEVDKKSLLGEQPGDEQEKVQYMNLHKKLQLILDLIKTYK